MTKIMIILVKMMNDSVDDNKYKSVSMPTLQFSQRLSQVGRVPTTAAAFPLWTARLSLCARNACDLVSPDSVANRPPISAQRARAEGPQAPRVRSEERRVGKECSWQ